MKDKKTRVSKMKASSRQSDPDPLPEPIHTMPSIETVKGYLEGNMKKILPKIERQIVKLEKSIEDHHEELSIKKEKLETLRHELNQLAYIKNNISSISM
jgi:hypothetical protein